MERRDRLYENYEDALFALLMDKVAEEEGARLFAENERLKNDPDAEVPESFDRASREAIRRAFSGQKRRATTRSFGIVLSKLAVAILAAMLLFGSAYAVFPSVRVRLLNWMIENSDVASRLTVVEDTDVEPFLDSDTLMGYQLPALSIKYSVVERKDGERESWIEYQHENGSMIRIAIETSRTAYLDIEEADFSKKVSIHGFSGTLAEKGDTVTITWNDTEHGMTLLLTCTELEKQLAVDYANGITFIGK